jgi:short-subunit dehydrogenase
MSEKVIVITGASAGIGAATAKLLAARGDKVVLAARRAAELQKVAAECSQNSLVVVTDVTHRQDVEHLRSEAIKTFGRIDVWVNNAGQGINAHVLEITDADFDEIMAVNVKSALYGMQAVVPYFKERKQGHLINVSSALARIPFASNRSIYSAAKAALNSLTANLRMDLRKEYPDIHVSVVMPPMVSTEFGKNALHAQPIAAGGYRGPTPQTPEQTAAAIVGLIDHPRAEVYTQPDQAEAVTRYFADVEAFEKNISR